MVIKHGLDLVETRQKIKNLDNNLRTEFLSPTVRKKAEEQLKLSHADIDWLNDKIDHHSNKYEENVEKLAWYKNPAHLVHPQSAKEVLKRVDKPSQRHWASKPTTLGSVLPKYFRKYFAAQGELSNITCL